MSDDLEPLAATATLSSSAAAPASVAPPPGILAPQDVNKWTVLSLAALATMLVWIDVTALNVAFSNLEASFADASRSAISWVLTGYNIVFAALLVPAGRLADAIGRKRTFLAGLLLFVVASGLCVAAPSVPILVAFRLLQAAGAAACIPSALALILAAFPPKEIATAVGMWISAAGVATVIGPLLGGALLDAGGWRWVFIINIPIGLVGLIASARILKEIRNARARLPDFLGAALVALAIGLIALDIVQGPEWGWTSGRTDGALVVALLCLAGALYRSRSHPSPAIDLALLSQRKIALANLGTLIFAVPFFAQLLLAVLVQVNVWHYSELAAGMGLLPTAAASAFASGPAGKLIDRYGPRWIGFAGVVLFGLSLLALLLGIGSKPNLTLWIGACAVLGVGVGGSYAAFGSTAVRSAPFPSFGLASALNATSRQIGAVLGVAITVTILGRPSADEALGAFHHAYTVAVAFSIVAALFALTLGAKAKTVK